MNQAHTQESIPYWVSEWFNALETVPFATIAPDPDKVVVMSTDMLVGFCRSGPLASDRVGALEEPVARLFTLAYESGVRKFVLTEDTHSPSTPEFNAWPPHCIAGTEESQTVPSLKELPFSDLFVHFPKDSLSAAVTPEFPAWLDAQPEIETAIVVGDCTDLCVYQLAMYLRLRANSYNLANFQVIVPADCVDTFDIDPATAAAGRGYVHPGDFYHQVFLHHLGLNDVRVVASLFGD